MGYIIKWLNSIRISLERLGVNSKFLSHLQYINIQYYEVTKRNFKSEFPSPTISKIYF